MKNSDKTNHLIRNLFLILLCFFFFLNPETIYKLFITAILQIVVTSEMNFLFFSRSVQNLKLLQLFLQISDFNTSNRHRTLSGKKSSHVDESCFKTNTVVWCEVNFFSISYRGLKTEKRSVSRGLSCSDFTGFSVKFTHMFLFCPLETVSF